ncbi:MAG: hypothetical protein KKC05_04165, partial [Nanoarchaeota archaeon]|nr:hypothetical protein [Nanoarchaeota archaeon]
MKKEVAVITFKLKPDISQITGKNGLVTINANRAIRTFGFEIDSETLEFWIQLDLIYRTLCAIMYNFAMSGHPGGSISMGRIMQCIIYNLMRYLFSNLDDQRSDVFGLAGGHKALGVYAAWALRDEMMRLEHSLPKRQNRFRLEDLLGFRRNPTQGTPLFMAHNCRPLDGHPTPATPGIRVATGASGYGAGSLLGLAMGLLDIFGEDSPRVHIVEGEGGLTPGRVSEVMSAAVTAGIWNAILHVDWNNASIDSDRVCPENGEPGDYVQWTPADFGRHHGWNVISVGDGHDFLKIMAAQQLAVQIRNQRPTMIVYLTKKGWKYGVDGKKSHGAGHAFCSDYFYDCLRPFENEFGVRFSRENLDKTDAGQVEKLYWDFLHTIRSVMGNRRDLTGYFSNATRKAGDRLKKYSNKMPGKRQLQKLHEPGVIASHVVPRSLILRPGNKTTLRGALGDALGYLNKLTEGAIIVSSADLRGSTSVSKIVAGFDDGNYHAVINPDSRYIPIGGICEDAMGAFASGVAASGYLMPVTASYAAFLYLEHISARLHSIGQQANGRPYNTWIMINAHAGPETGEDGSTHADSQALQGYQGNFPRGSLITLTPWDPAEIWPLLVKGLLKRPAVLCPFVTRPEKIILNRKEYNLPRVATTVNGVYPLRKAVGKSNGTIILQGSGVTYIFIKQVLPALDILGFNLNVYYVSSAELFDMLSTHKQQEIYPDEIAREAMAITDFTLSTMDRWLHSSFGRDMSLHPFRKGRYLGSGQANMVFKEAEMDGEGQIRQIVKYVDMLISKKRKKSIV